MLRLLLFKQSNFWVFVLLLVPEKKIAVDLLLLHGMSIMTVVLSCYTEPEFDNGLPIVTSSTFTARTFTIRVYNWFVCY